jgi:SNF family Na+-dependent transporter
MGNLVLVPISFILLICLIIYYLSLNSMKDGRGIDFYMGTQKIPQLEGGSTNIDSLFLDSYTYVFYSLGLCTGIHFSYSSYNHIKKPIIMDSAMISISTLFFSVLCGFITWGAIGYLNAVNHPAQAQSTSVG